MNGSGDAAYVALTVAGLAIVTVITRSFFLLPEREVPIPDWLRRGLKVAPLAALTAVIVPEIVMTQGRLIDSWQDARLPAALAASVWYAWRPACSGRFWRASPCFCRCGCCGVGKHRPATERAPLNSKIPSIRLTMNAIRFTDLIAANQVAGKRVFIGVDFDALQQDADGRITDDTRIRASLPCIEAALKAGAAVMVTSPRSAEGRPVDG